MEKEVKVQDCVQLIHGFSPFMTVSEINEEDQTAKCVWFDQKGKKSKNEIIPLNVLKHCPEKVSPDRIKDFFGIK